MIEIIPLLGLAGLFLDGIGAVVIILPDFSALQSRLMPEEQMERLRTGQQTLLREHELTPEDVGFSAVVDVLEEEVVDLPTVPDKIFVDEKAGSGELEVQVQYNIEEADHAYATDFAGLPAHVAMLIELAIEDLEQKVRTRFLRYGVFLLVGGFLLQIVSFGIRNGVF